MIGENEYHGRPLTTVYLSYTLVYMIENDIKIKSNKNKRFADLAALGEVVFHAGDLANIWRIRSRNTLAQTLSRYTRLGHLKRIHKGFYSLKDPKELDAQLLGLKALHRYAYISCESVLSKHGIINQSPLEITIVSSVSKRCTVAGRRYRSRKLADRFLHNMTGVDDVLSVPTASLPRAVADMLYFNPKTYFDAHGSNLIDWNRVKEIAGAVGYHIRLPQ